MTGYPDVPDAYPGQQAVPPSGGRGPLRVNGTRLWSAGVATAVVAALVALVGVLIVRTLLRIDVYSPAASGAFGNGTTVVLAVVAALSALVATGLIHLLILSTPRPFAYFSWIVGLVTTAAVVMPFTYGSTLAVALAQAVLHLIIGTVVGSLVSKAASSAIRSAVLAPPRRDPR